MAAVLSWTAERWARANAVSSPARRAASARGMATVAAQAQDPPQRPQGRPADEGARPPFPAREHLDDAGDDRHPAEDEPPVVIARQDGGDGLARDRTVDRAEDERRDAEGEEGHDPEPAGDRDDGEAPEDPHSGRSIGEASGRVKLTGSAPGGTVPSDARPSGAPRAAAYPPSSVSGDPCRRGADAPHALPRGPDGDRPRAQPARGRGRAGERGRHDHHALLRELPLGRRPRDDDRGEARRIRARP